MTILFLTDDTGQGQKIAAQVGALAPTCLCLTMAPADLDAAIKEVRVDCVVCPPELAEDRTDRRPQYVAWPEGGVTEEWVRALIETAAYWGPPKILP